MSEEHEIKELSVDELKSYFRLRMLLASMESEDPRRDETDDKLMSLYRKAPRSQREKLSKLDNELHTLLDGLLAESKDRKLLRAALLYNLCILAASFGGAATTLRLQNKVTEYLNTKGFPVPTISPGSKLDDLLLEMGKEFL